MTLSHHNRIRLGGSVKRFHTWRTVGEQTVAAHSWGVLAIILAIEPEASAALLRRAVYHDLAEYDTGDIPSTAKWASPELKTLLDRLEDRFNHIYNFPGDETLTPVERDILKLADWIEMLWYSYEQAMLGNSAMKVVYVRVCEAISKRAWMEGAHRQRASDMMLEIEQLWLDMAEGEPS